MSQRSVCLIRLRNTIRYSLLVRISTSIVHIRSSNWLFTRACRSQILVHMRTRTAESNLYVNRPTTNCSLEHFLSASFAVSKCVVRNQTVNNQHLTENYNRYSNGHSSETASETNIVSILGQTYRM